VFQMESFSSQSSTEITESSLHSSWVWDYFEKNNITKIATCKLCPKLAVPTEFQIPTFNGTNPIAHHLIRFHQIHKPAERILKEKQAKKRREILVNQGALEEQL
jgi:hypothetical protein